MVNLSIIFPIYNEEEILKQNTLKTINYLENLELVDNFEVLLCPNGCTDNTVKIAENLAKKDKRVKCYPKTERGIGVGLREGIKKAKYEYSMFYAIDIPFGFEVIENSIKEIKNADIVIGSKSHPDSEGYTNPKRKTLSSGYNALIKLLFQLKVNDTQGSLLFNTKHVSEYLGKLTSNSPFLQTQIIIYGNKNKLKIKEIKTKFRGRKRKSKINIRSEIIRMLKDIVKERIEF